MLKILQTNTGLASGRNGIQHVLYASTRNAHRSATVATLRPCPPHPISTFIRSFQTHPKCAPSMHQRTQAYNSSSTQLLKSLIPKPVQLCRIHTSSQLYTPSSLHALPSHRQFLHLYSRTRRKSASLLRYKSTVGGSPRNQNATKSPTSKGNASKGGATTAASGAAKVASEQSSLATKQKHLLDRLPHMPYRMHRPTKEELLAAATGFWSRLRVRFKWFSIRELRPFNMDDISAFFSWILVGHLIWIIVGTTTFFSLVIFSLNTVFAQETIAKWVGNYLTKSSGLKVVFESAIVPEWKGGVITFNNVFVSRRPGQSKATVSKGSRDTAVADAVAAGRLHGQEEEDTNYTQFDVTIENISVTLSFTRWFNGRGLLRDVEMKGVRGIVDRTSVHWRDEEINPLSLRHQHHIGDFELDSFKLEDLLVTIYQPHNFRPFSVSIFSADLPQLRKQWLFYDMLSANHMSGSFDESLFTIHPRQTHNVTGARLQNSMSNEGPSEWKKHSRIRIDGLSIDHLNRGVEGPFSWIREGNVDIVADIMFPADDEESIAKVMSDFYDRMEATVTTNRIPLGRVESSRSTQHGTADESTSSETNEDTIAQDDKDRFLIMDLRVHLNDVHASVPIFTRDLSYVNNALVRPIVAYINSKKAFIPINCRIVKRISDFDGSWTIYDSLLMDDLSRETYDAFARDVGDDQARMRRIKKVGMWSLQLAVQALFLGLAGNVA